jgi:hypothetical protein
VWGESLRMSSRERSDSAPRYVHFLDKGVYDMEKRRLSIDISEEDQVRMHNLIPWGITGRLIRMLFLQTLDMIESHGVIVLGAIMSGELSALDILVKGGKDGLSRLEDERK